MQSYTQVANYTKLFFFFLLFSMFLKDFLFLCNFFSKKNEERLCTPKKVPKFEKSKLTLIILKAIIP